MRHRNGRRKSFARRLCREAAPESLGARIGAMPTTADGLHGDAVRSTSHRLSLVGETWNHRDSIRREAAAKAGRRAATAPVRGGVDDRQNARPHVRRDSTMAAFPLSGLAVWQLLFGRTACSGTPGGFSRRRADWAHYGAPELPYVRHCWLHECAAGSVSRCCGFCVQI